MRTLAPTGARRLAHINRRLLADAPSRLARAGLVVAALACTLPAQRTLLPEKSEFDPVAPSVAVGNDGRVAITFVDDKTIYLCLSEDGGATFDEPIEVTTEKALAAADARRPHVAITERGFVVTANSGKQLRGKDGDLNAWFSNDAQRWGPRTRINSVKSSSLEGLHGIAAGPGGRVVATWLDQREGKRNHVVMAAVSDDGGKTWADDVLVYASPDGAVCVCCAPNVTVDASGRAHVLWRNDLDGNRDMYVAMSDASVREFGPARLVDDEAWELHACPMQGGALAVDAGGRIEAVWFHKGRALEAPLDAQGEPGRVTTLGPGKDVGIAAGPDGFVRLRVTSRRILLTSEAGPSGDAPVGRSGASTAESFEGRHPMIAGAPDGRGPVVLVYEADAPGSQRLRYAVVQSRQP